MNKRDQELSPDFKSDVVAKAENIMNVLGKITVLEKEAEKVTEAKDALDVMSACYFKEPSNCLSVSPEHLKSYVEYGMDCQKEILISDIEKLYFELSNLMV
jgi:hypothetical protein